jgi:hypothetical protein
MRLSHKRHESERLVSGAGHARVGRAPGAPPACEPTLAIPLEAAALSRVLAVRGPPLAAAASRRTDLTIMSRAPPCERRTRAGTGGREIPAKRPVQQVAGLPGAAARFRARGPVVDPRRGGAKDRQAGRCARLAAKVSSDLAPSPPVGGTDYSAPMGRPDRQPPARQAVMSLSAAVNAAQKVLLPRERGSGQEPMRARGRFRLIHLGRFGPWLRASALHGKGDDAGWVAYPAFPAPTRHLCV